jgi:hypothetical protein
METKNGEKNGKRERETYRDNIGIHRLTVFRAKAIAGHELSIMPDYAL